MKEKLLTLKEAASSIDDHSSVAIGGMSFHRAPMALVREMVKQTRKGLTLIGREEGLSFDLLIGSNCVKKALAAYIGFENLGLAPNFRKKVEKGEIKFEEHACQSIVTGLRASAMGLPFLPTRGFLGSDVMGVHNGRDLRVIDSPFTGEKLVAVRAIEPDVTIIHAQMSDPYGNTRIIGQMFEDDLMVKAAKKVIVTAEEIVDTDDIRKHPEMTAIPHFMVDGVVKAPKGAYPCSCYCYYDADMDHFREYLDLCRKGALDGYIDKYVR